MSLICSAKAFMRRPSCGDFHCETLKFSRIWLDLLTSCLPASLIITSLSLVTESNLPIRRRVSRESLLGQILNVELECEGYRKAGCPQYLRAIRQKLHG